ncbi:transcriptional regulator ATRX-like [Tigriopus californicus]|uniref:transcriptional regulator ATRX-like n=1 Tax=Tigriopus californicus TaxID=6832 RepID=UPI0027D9E32D|nr:transcriptional regulator ATRX-like [Tigriopus californicus]
MGSSEALSRETSTRLSTLFHVGVPGGSLLSLDAQSRWVLIHGILQAYDSSWKLPDWPVIVGHKSESLPWPTSVVPDGPNGNPKDDWLSRKKDMAEIKRWITLLNVGHLLPKKFEFEDDMKFIHFVGTLMDKIGATLGTTKLMANVRVIVKKQARSNALQIGGKTNRDHLNRISTNSVVKSEDESDPLDKENVVPVANSVTSEDEDNDDPLANIIPSGLQLPRTPMVRSTSFQSELSEEETEDEKPLVLEEESMNEKCDDRANEKESPKNLIPTGKEIPRTPYVNPYRPMPDEDEVSTEDEKIIPAHAFNETFDAKADEIVRAADDDNLTELDEKLNVPVTQCPSDGLLDQTFDVVEGKPKLATKDDSKTAVSKQVKPTKSRKKPSKVQVKKPDHLKVPTTDTNNGDEQTDSPFFKHDGKPCVKSAPEVKSANVEPGTNVIKEVIAVNATDVVADAKDIEPEQKSKKGRKAKSAIEGDIANGQDEKETIDSVDKLVPKAKRTAKIKAISGRAIAAKTTELQNEDQDAKATSEKAAEMPLTKLPRESKRKGKGAPSQDNVDGVSNPVTETSEEKTDIDTDKGEAKKGRRLRVPKPAVNEQEENAKSVKPTKKEKEALMKVETNEPSKVEPENVKKGRKPKTVPAVVETEEPIEPLEPGSKSAPKAKRDTKKTVKTSLESEEPEVIKEIDTKKRGIKRGQKSAQDEESEVIETKKKTRSMKNKGKATEEPAALVVECMDDEDPVEEKEDEPVPTKKGRNPRAKAQTKDNISPKVKKQLSKKVKDKATKDLDTEQCYDLSEPKVEKLRKTRGKKTQSTQKEEVAENPKFASDDEPQEEKEEAMDADLEEDQNMKIKPKEKKGRKGKVETAQSQDEAGQLVEEKMSKRRKVKAKPSDHIESKVVEKPNRGSKKAHPEKAVECSPNLVEDNEDEKEVSFKEKPSTKRGARTKIMKPQEKSEDKGTGPVPKKAAKKRRASSLNSTQTREHLKLALLKAKEAEDALNNGGPSPPKVKMTRKKGTAKTSSSAPISDQSSDKGGGLSKTGAVSGQAIKEESREQKLELLDRLFDRKKQKGVGKTNNKDVNLEEPTTKLGNTKKSAKSANPDNTIQESLDELVVPSSASMDVNDGLCSTSKVEKGRKASKKIKKSDQEAEVPSPTKTARKHSKKK